MRRLLLASLAVVCLVALGAAAMLLRGPPRPAASAAGGPLAAPQAGREQASLAASALSRQADAGPQDPSAPPVKRQPTHAAPVWTVDKAASRLIFRGVMDDQGFDGVFRSWDAQIAFDPSNLAGSHAAITVDTASALTGQPIKDQALPNSEWLDTEAFPQATLITRSLRELSPGRYEAQSDIRIRGVAWRATVPFTVSIVHDTGRMDATLSLDRRTFGIGEGPFRSPAPLEPTVQVVMKLVAKRTR